MELLPRLFEKAAIPSAVADELCHEGAPAAVKAWINARPEWLEVHGTEHLPVPVDLDEGEAAAIAPAEALSADLVLLDDRAGVRLAQQKGLRVTGTLGLLDLAAERGLLDFAEAIRSLERTNFHRPRSVLEVLLRKHSSR